MGITIHPLADYVLAKPDESATKTANGLYLPPKSGEKTKTAKVSAVGGAVKEVKVGERIVHKEYGFTGVKDSEGNEYMLIKEEDILATIKESK